MNLEQKILYYSCYYEDYGLPKGVNTTDFFDEELLDYLSKEKNSYIKIKCINFIELLSSSELFDKTIHILFNYNLSEINSNNFYDLIVNNNNLLNYVSNKIINNSIDYNFFKLLKDIRTLELLKNLSQSNVSFFVKALKFIPIDKLKEMLKDPVWKKIYYFTHYDKFFNDIKLLGADTIGMDIIINKIRDLSYNETIEVLMKYYDVSNGEPSYLHETYKKYKNEFRKHKIGKLLEDLNENSNEEMITNVRKLINSNIGMEILYSFKLDKIESITKILGLNQEIKDNRKSYFLEILNNYEEYSLDTVKNVFSLYYFEELYSNIMIDIGVILKYANSNEEVKKILGDLFEELEIIYNYLNGNKNINPIEIMLNTSINSNTINSLINKMYNLFNMDVNKNTNSEIVLKNAIIEEKNGVVIYHLDNTNDSMFLIHSIDTCDEYYYNYFFEKSKNYSKLCMSLLDANHTSTFVKGIIFGYLNIQNQLYSATVCDGQTNQRISLLRQYNSDLIPINQFMNSTNQNSYNELAYLTNNKPIMPSYILCIDKEPNDVEIKIAQDFKIPIYVYPRKKEIIKLPNVEIEHKNYDYETKRIQILHKSISKEITVPSVGNKNSLK